MIWYTHFFTATVSGVHKKFQEQANKIKNHINFNHYICQISQFIIVFVGVSQQLALELLYLDHSLEVLFYPLALCVL